MEQRESAPAAANAAGSRPTLLWSLRQQHQPQRLHHNTPAPCMAPGMSADRLPRHAAPMQGPPQRRLPRSSTVLAAAASTAGNLAESTRPPGTWQVLLQNLRRQHYQRRLGKQSLHRPWSASDQVAAALALALADNRGKGPPLSSSPSSPSSAATGRLSEAQRVARIEALALVWAGLREEAPHMQPEESSEAAYLAAQLLAATRTTQSRAAPSRLPPPFPGSSEAEELDPHSSSATRQEEQTIQLLLMLMRARGRPAAELSPGACAKLAWAAAMAEGALDPQWWTQLCEALSSRGALEQLGGEQVATLLWALARVQPRLIEQQQQEQQEHLEEAGSSGRDTARRRAATEVHKEAEEAAGHSLEVEEEEAVVVAGGPASTALRASSRLASLALSASRSELPWLGSRQLMGLLWAVSELQLSAAPRGWLRDFLAAAEVQLPYMHRRQLTKMALSLARLQCPIPPAFCTLVALASVACLDDMSAAELSSLIWAFGRLRSPLSWPILAALVDHFKTLVDRCPPSGLCSVVWALPIISATYPDHLVKHRKYLLMALAKRSLGILADCSPRQLAQLITGFTRLGYYPGALWMKQHREACILRRDQFDRLTRQQVRAAYQKLLVQG